MRQETICVYFDRVEKGSNRVIFIVLSYSDLAHRANEFLPSNLWRNMSQVYQLVTMINVFYYNISLLPLLPSAIRIFFAQKTRSRVGTT